MARLQTLRPDASCFLRLAGITLVAALAQACTSDPAPEEPVSVVAPASTGDPSSVESSPLEWFGRFVGGSWHITFESGEAQYDTWRWGPGMHSLHAQTYGTGGGGDPWRALTVLYWHPAEQAVRVLRLSPFQRGVAQGAVTFGGDVAEAVVDMYQTGQARALGQRWTFSSSDRYVMRLWDIGHPPLGEWTYVRSTTDPRRSGPLSASEPDGAPPGPSGQLQAVASILDTTWASRNDDVEIQSDVEWIPYCEGVSIRTTITRGNSDPIHLLDTYLYRHTGTGALRCLALSNTGGVYEGDVAVDDRGGLDLDLTMHEGTTVSRYAARLEFDQDGMVRHRVWLVEDDERQPRWDLEHRPVGDGPSP